MQSVFSQGTIFSITVGCGLGGILTTSRCYTPPYSPHIAEKSDTVLVWYDNRQGTITTNCILLVVLYPGQRGQQYIFVKYYDTMWVESRA